MTVIDLNLQRWSAALSRWSDEFRARCLAPVRDESRTSAKEKLRLPEELVALYRVTNGVRRDWFAVLPIEDPADVKGTWDGLLRANDPRATRFLKDQPELLSRFVVFAQLQGGRCALVDRTDGSIWFEEADGVSQTTFTLMEFVEASLREAAFN